MGMKGKDVPKKHGSRDQPKHAPDHGSRPFRDQRTGCRSLNRYVPAQRVCRQMHIVRKRQARAAASTIAKIATYPERVDLGLDGGLQQLAQRSCPAGGRIADVMNGAAVRIRVKYVLE